MQQLTELPKAEKGFKQIVDKKVENYIDRSQQVANEYIKQKNQADTNASKPYQHLQQIKRQLQILRAVQMTGVQLSGSSRHDVRQLIQKYQRLVADYDQKLVGESIQQYNRFKQEQDNQLDKSFDRKFSQIDSRSNVEEEELISSQFLLPEQTMSKKNNMNRCLIVGMLKSLQFVVLVLMIACVIRVLFFS